MSTTRNTDPIEVFVRDQRRRRWSLSEKQTLVRRTYEPNLSDACAVMRQLPAAFEHFNEVHPHASLKMGSPWQFRCNQTAKQCQNQPAPIGVKLRIGHVRLHGGKIESAKKLLASGIPPKDVAKNLGVSVPTLYGWVPASARA